MLKKFALCEAVPLNINADKDNNSSGKKLGMVRTAAGRVFIEPNSDKARVIQAEIDKHPTALFFRAKAIKADEPNSNGDYFSQDELLRSYKSFEGVPFFTNHDNQNVENARGKIIHAEWVPEENSVYTISFVDREAFPHICRSIEEEYVTGVSMGCSVEYSICNICENKAEKTDDYCWHIRERKGRTFSGKSRNVKTGETKEFNKEPVFEYNYGIKFIELSAVVDPACPSCRIEGLISNDDYLKKVANMENALRMIKTAAIEKNASQEEIGQLTQCLQTLEGIAVGLIQNRQQVEVDFASDLVNILSELQKFTDELVGAGYGNVQGGIPGVGQEDQVPQDGLAPQEGVAPTEAMPVASETPLGGEVGDVSGAPTSPLVKSPQLPITAPAKPIAFDGLKIQRIAEKLEKLATYSKLIDVNEETGEDEMGKRRTKLERIEQKRAATEVLSNSWQEKQEFFEYINRVPSVQDNDNRISVKKRDDSFIIVAEKKEGPEQEVWTFEDLSDGEKDLITNSPKEAALYFLDTFADTVGKKTIKEGDKVMTNEKRQAGAQSVNKDPQVVQEAQLEKTRDLYHARTDAEQNSITEGQLANDGGSHKRTGEPEVITEAQLDAKSNKLHPREEIEREVVQEAQLRNDRSGVSPRKESEPNVVTQKQLSDNGNRTGNEPQVITERQLEDIATPWERAANRDSSMFKSAGEHLAGVIDVLANTAIATGCTPEEVCEVAGSLVDSTKGRFELGNAILEDIRDEDVDCSKRLAYWSSKNIKVASVGRTEIADSIVRGLRRVASDETINPEVVIDAMDVISDGEDAQVGVSRAIDSKLESAKSETVKASVRKDLKKALQESVHGKEVTSSVDSVDAKLTREAEREVLEKMLDTKTASSADTMIETDFSELGCNKNDPNFRSSIKSFAKGALASHNIKLAAITNVTINGDTISIAVQTDTGEESVEIPVGEEIEPMDEELVPEGDLAGEGLGGALGNEVPPAPPTMASKKTKLTRKAQSPMGGGVPGTPGDVAGGPGGGGGLPGEAPMGEPVEALTMDEGIDEVSDEIPTAGEQQMPYAICPECGSMDTDVEKGSEGNITGSCQACGAEYEALIEKNVKFKILKPTKSVGEEGTTGAPEAPEVPALPIAAQTKLNKNVLTRIASNKSKFGHVCPACGMNQCKVASEGQGHTEFDCPACGTHVDKDMIVNVNNPDENFLRVKWDIVPNVEGCDDCAEAASKFASLLKVEGLMKTASSGESPFPMANCMERIARQYGGNATATFGPCKGKPLADCVCGQLEKLALTKVRHLQKLAEVYTQDDPMEQCVEDQKSKGYEVKEAETICNCLKKKFASEDDDNVFMQAFAEDISSGKEKILTAQDLRTINEIINNDEVEVVEEEVYEDEDIGGDIEPLEEEVTEETVTIEVSKETAEELADAVEEANQEAPEEVEIEIEEDIPDMGSATELEVAEEAPLQEERELAMAMQEHKLRRVGEEVVKVAGTPKQIQTIEKDVEAGVPRSKATIGGEGSDNIDVPMAKPSVPRSKATMGKEGPDNIDKPAGLPNVPVDSSYMGEEKSIQSGMPAINNEIKGTVIADVEGTVVKEAKQLTEVDTVEKDVEAGVPRAKATQGEEGADNIDVPMAKPSVPRGNAEMGNEGADNINPSADGPDVPVDSSYMGEEKSVQSDMPAINSEMLKNVQQSHNKDKQQERIANARKMKAVEVAAKLLATSRINEAAYEDVIEALQTFEIDKIASKADSMYPVRKTASKPAPEGHAIPAIVQESAPIVNNDDSLQSRLAGSFTIGNKSFDENLTIYGEK